MIQIKHPETGEELEFTTKKEIIDYFDLDISYSAFTLRCNKIGFQEALNYYYLKNEKIKVTNPETGEELEFDNENEIWKHFQLNCSIKYFKKKVRNIGLQEALDYFYFKKSEMIKVTHPETDEELEFTTKKEIVNYFDLKISCSAFNIESNKIGIQEALNYYFLNNKSRFIKVKHPETGEELEFKNKKAIFDYFDLAKKTDINYFYDKIKSMDIQKVLEYYIINKNIKVKDPETGEELTFKSIKEMWEYFDIEQEHSYSTFWGIVNKLGPNEAIKKIKSKKTINFRNLEFKTYRELKKYFKLNSFNSSFINRYDYLTIEEIVIMLKLKQGYIFIDNSYDDFYFQEISQFAKEKGLSEEYVIQKLNEGFTHKDF